MSPNPPRRCSICGGEVEEHMEHPICRDCMMGDAPYVPTHIPIGTTATADLMRSVAKGRIGRPTAERRTVKCPCGTAMDLPPGRARKRKYCSPECTVKYRTTYAGGTKTSVANTPGLDAEIIRIYQEEVRLDPKASPVKDLAERYGFGVNTIHRRAAMLGANITRTVPWTPEETRVLTENIDFSTKFIRQQLMDAGFHRSLTGVKVKREKMLDNSEAIPLRMTKNQVATMMKVHCATVNDWMDEGLLMYEEKGNKDIRLVTPRALMRFIRLHYDLVDFRRVDKELFFKLMVVCFGEA